jgi:hypothetical protein
MTTEHVPAPSHDPAVSCALDAGPSVQVAAEHGVPVA